MSDSHVVSEFRHRNTLLVLQVKGEKDNMGVNCQEGGKRRKNDVKGMIYLD